MTVLGLCLPYGSNEIVSIDVYPSSVSAMFLFGYLAVSLLSFIIAATFTDLAFSGSSYDVHCTNQGLSQACVIAL